jgi:hypothetical protein
LNNGGLPITPNVLWQGQTRKAISTELQQAFDRIISFTKQDEFVESARELVLAIDDFEVAFRRLAREGDA